MGRSYPRMTTFSVGFGNRLRRMRVSRGLSRQELADECGFPKSNIDGYELGYHEPPASRIATMATVLGASADVLFGLEE